jgi:hypothetical protein
MGDFALRVVLHSAGPKSDLRSELIFRMHAGRSSHDPTMGSVIRKQPAIQQRLGGLSISSVSGARCLCIPGGRSGP